MDLVMKKHQSFWNFIPIIIVLCSGYIAGGYLTFGVRYLNFFPSLTNPMARLTLILFGMGILGASIYCLKFWSNDVCRVLYEDYIKLPHIFDFLGYTLTILGGGVTGVLLYLIARIGINLASNFNTVHEINFPAAILLSIAEVFFTLNFKSG